MSRLITTFFTSSVTAQKLNPPKELLQIMEQSELSYELHELKKEIPAPDNRFIRHLRKKK